MSFLDTINRLEKLYEAKQLVEDIAAVRKIYPSIPDEDFDSIIRLDPTFKEDKDSVGTYGKWLLSQFKKGNISTDEYLKVKTPAGEDINISITELLKDFDSAKKDNTVQLATKDINAISDPAALLEVVDSSTNKELSDRQKLRQRRKNKDYDYFDVSPEWEVYIPNSWEASVALGTGTSWCTADSRPEYGKKKYEEYLEKGGKYYILKSKHNGERYQFHFETEQFMDESDSPVKVADFVDDSALVEFFKNQGYSLEDYIFDVESAVISRYWQAVPETNVTFRELSKLLPDVISNIEEEDLYVLGDIIDAADGYRNPEDFADTLGGYVYSLKLWDKFKKELSNKNIELNPDLSSSNNSITDLVYERSLEEWFTRALSDISINKDYIDVDLINEILPEGFVWDYNHFNVTSSIEDIMQDIEYSGAEINSYSEFELFIDSLFEYTVFSQLEADDPLVLHAAIFAQEPEWENINNWMDTVLEKKFVQIIEQESDSIMELMQEYFEYEYEDIAGDQDISEIPLFVKK